MSFAVKKYEIAIDGDYVDMPSGSKILHVTDHDGAVLIWALVDPSRPMVERDIIALVDVSQAPSPDEADYVGTVTTLTGGVIHYFAVREREA